MGTRKNRTISEVVYFDELGFYHQHDYQSSARCWCGWNKEDRMAGRMLWCDKCKKFVAHIFDGKLWVCQRCGGGKK